MTLLFPQIMTAIKRRTLLCLDKVFGLFFRVPTGNPEFNNSEFLPTNQLWVISTPTAEATLPFIETAFGMSIKVFGDLHPFNSVCLRIDLLPPIMMLTEKLILLFTDLREETGIFKKAATDLQAFNSETPPIQ